MRLTKREATYRFELRCEGRKRMEPDWMQRIGERVFCFVWLCSVSWSLGFYCEGGERGVFMDLQKEGECDATILGFRFE